MLKSQAILEVKTGDRVYQLNCNSESPLGELYDAICQMRGYVIKRMEEDQKATEAKAAIEPELVEVVD